MTGLAARTLAFSVLISFISRSQASPADLEAGSAKSTALAWLKKAREAADRMDAGPDDGTLFGTKAAKLGMIAGTYLDLGEIDEAKAVAEGLPEREKQSFLAYVPVSFAHAGRFDEAVREAEEVSNPSTWAIICVVMARKDFPRALAMEDKVPPAKRDWAWESIAKDQVLAGNFKAAQTAAEKVEHPEQRERAERWLAAGRFAEGAQADGAPGADIAAMERQLADIAEAKCKAGNIEKARRLLSVMKNADCRCRVHISMAELQLKRNLKAEFRESINAALKEVAAIDDPVMAELLRAVNVLKIARLQGRAGDFDEAMKTIALADESGKAESKKWEDLGIKGGGFFTGFGGRIVLIQLLIEAGKTDDAVKMATREDGTLAPDAVPLLAAAYAVAGKMNEFDALIKSAKSPESECALHLAVAMWAATKAKEEAEK